MSLASPSTQNLLKFHWLLRSHFETGNLKSPLVLLRQVLDSGSKPNDLTFSLLLKSSVSNPALLITRLEANAIQTHLVKSGLDSFVYLSTALLDLHAKLGCVDSARKVFDCMPVRDVVAWNALICGYSRNGCDSDALGSIVQMLREGFAPNGTTLVGVVSSCGKRDLMLQGKAVHGLGVKAGFDLDCQVKNAFISMYGKSGDLSAAEVLFEEVEEKSVVSWNTMVGIYSQNGLFDETMLLFKRMVEERVEVNPVTVINLLSSKADPKWVHCHVIKNGLASDANVTTSLVCSYATSGSVESAELLFASVRQKSLVSLTTITLSYAEKGYMRRVVECYEQMQHLDMKLDPVAMVSILHGITDPSNLGLGRAFHGHALKTGLNFSILVANGLITMYSKLNDIETAFSLFYEMDQKSLITWNSMISGCVQAGRMSDAMETFCQMTESGCMPDAFTVASLLSACSQLGYFQLGQKLHNYIVRNNLEQEEFVGTALVDMYTKCGSIEQAEKVFKSIKKPCIAVWNTMISGYSWYGCEHKALTCYSRMQEQSLEPDLITFLGFLAACVYGGFVDEGRRFFRIMTEELGLRPTLQHYACMVALLGRAGQFEEAMLFIKNMKTKPDSAVWGALLAACCIHQEVMLGEWLAKKMYLLDHTNGGLYVLMSNLYAAAGKWDDVARVREMMRNTGGNGCAGVSQIQTTSSELDQQPNALFL